MSKEFKVGDKVRVLEDAPRGQFIKGCIYEVSLVYEEDGDTRIEVVADSNGETNGWLADYFELVESFDDLIDVAVQAYKDGAITSQLTIMSTGIHFFGEERAAISFANSSRGIEEGIKFINSLYTEKFVIGKLDDLKKINLKNSVVKFLNGFESQIKSVDWQSDGGNISLYDGEFYVDFDIIKGATVTQKSS